MSTLAADPPMQSDGDVHDLLCVAVVDAKRLGSSLEELVDQPGHRQATVVRRSSITGSSPSWHAQAAYLVLELGQMARQLEGDLRMRIADSDRPRGGSDRNTVLALEALPALAQGASERDVWDVWSLLDRWCRRARQVLGEVEPLTLLPRQPGRREPRCPWCRCHTLRYQRYAGVVRCINPACCDSYGDRPVGRIELGRVSGETLLAWRDGTVGLAEDA